MTVQIEPKIQSYLSARPQENKTQGILSFPVLRHTPALEANSYYFGRKDWARGYLACHQYRAFKDRWQALMGSWEDKIVVDVGCGPGNVYRSLRKRCGTPRLLIGVDVARGGLELAAKQGYIPVLADAQDLPFVSEFADIVVVNATLHHSDDMEQVLREAARLVRPGGLLVTDHDPQKSMFNDNLMAKLIWNGRLPIYRWMKRGGHSTADEQYWSTATEVHHKPGDGVTPKLFHETLEPMGFQVRLYPHNMKVGGEIVRGDRGLAPQKVRLAQRLTGVNPDSVLGAMMLMCVAVKH